MIKGVVSLVNGMKWIYKDAAKSQIFGGVLTSMCQTMENEMALSPEDEEEQDPTVQMWLYSFLAQHNLRSANATEALKYIEKAISHTPTVVELYLIISFSFIQESNPNYKNHNHRLVLNDFYSSVEMFEISRHM